MARKLVGQIAVEEALSIVYALLQPDRLSTVQELVLRQSWSGRTYEEIAEASGYSVQHIRDVGCKLWQLLSNALGEKVNKCNFQSVLGHRLREWKRQSQQVDNFFLPSSRS